MKFIANFFNYQQSFFLKKNTNKRQDGNGGVDRSDNGSTISTISTIFF